MALPWINQSSFIAAITEGLIHIFHLHFNLTSTKMSCFERDLKNAPQNAAPMALETRRYKTAATAQFMLKLKKSKKNFVENILDYFFIYLLFWLLQYLPVIGVVRVVFRGVSLFSLIGIPEFSVSNSGIPECTFLECFAREFAGWNVWKSKREKWSEISTSMGYGSHNNGWSSRNLSMNKLKLNKLILSIKLLHYLKSNIFNKVHILHS